MPFLGIKVGYGVSFYTWGTLQMQSGNIAEFQYLSQFRDLKDFNNNMEQWMIDVKDKFTKSELVALKRLIRFSAKITGVCNAKIATVVSATHENDGIGISRSTFKRMILKAKELGMLMTHETVRKNGSKSSNVYVFNHFELSNVEKLNRPQTDNPLKATKLKDIRTDVNDSNEKEVVLDTSYVSEKVPAAFTNLVKCFFDDAKMIEEYWKLVTISARKNKVEGDMLETAMQSFRVLVRKIKGNKVNNAYGFFYGILNRRFKALFEVELFYSWWEVQPV